MEKISVKKLGMQKEFRKWIQLLESKIEVGDKVLCIDPPYERYRGLYGIVTKKEYDKFLDIKWLSDTEDLVSIGLSKERFRKVYK